MLNGAGLRVNALRGTIGGSPPDAGVTAARSPWYGAMYPHPIADRMRRAHPLLLVFTAVLAACHPGSASEPKSAGVRIESNADSVAVTNLATTPLHWTAISQARLSLWDPYFCVEPMCAGLPAGATDVLPWSRFGPADASDRDYQVITWRAQSDGNGRSTAGDFHTWNVTR